MATEDDIKSLQLDLGKTAASLQLLVQRNQSDIAGTVRQLEDMRQLGHKASVSHAAEHAALQERVKVLEKQDAKEDTQQHSTRLELLDQRLTMVEARPGSNVLRKEFEEFKLAHEGKLALHLEDKKSRWAFWTAVSVAFIGGLVGLLSGILPYLFGGHG